MTSKSSSISFALERASYHQTELLRSSSRSRSVILVVFIILLVSSPLSVSDASLETHQQDGDSVSHDLSKESCAVTTGDSSVDSVCSSQEDCDTGGCRDDDPVACQTRGVKDCDGIDDPSWMLLHCRKTCRLCLEGDVVLEQNAGLGKLPPDVSVQVLRVIRSTNLYYEETLLKNWSYALLVTDTTVCRDQQDMCAFWAFRGQCESVEYVGYMDRECPLTCQRCPTDLLRGRAFLQFLLGNMTQVYDGDEANDSEISDVVASRNRSLSLLMSTIGMDAQLLGKPLTKEAGNWLETLHERLHALIPPGLRKLYRKKKIDMTEEDFELLASLHGLDTKGNRAKVLTNVLMPYRSRGYIVSIMRDVDHLITRPVQLGIGFAVPNEDTLAKIEAFVGQDDGAIVQMGVGAGYWAGLLRHRGVKVFAYDLHPPTTRPDDASDDNEDASNAFFDVAYMNDIQQGSCTSIFENNPQLATDRALLLIWPNDPDPVDNEQFCGGGDECQGSEPVWDADCLQSYLYAGGQKVIYVGERESQIRVRKNEADCGISSTRRFQRLLSTQFSLVSTTNIPNWWLNEDDVTMWERRIS